MCVQRPCWQADRSPILARTQKQLPSFSCLQRDKTWACIVPLRPISSSPCYLWRWADPRSARWWWTGGVSGRCRCVASPLCRPLPVPASAAAVPPRFSIRKRRLNCLSLQIRVPSTLLFMWHSICYVKHMISLFITHKPSRLTHCQWGVYLDESHLFVPMAPPQHFILALPVRWGRVWNQEQRRRWHREVFSPSNLETNTI